MRHNIQKLEKMTWPKQLFEIPEPPEQLFCVGENPFQPRDPSWKYICIVGSRKHSAYGKDACESIIRELKGLPITVVSGLAMGIDTVAHRSALKHGLHTIAIPGSGLQEKVLYPRQNISFAKEIVESGGALISEYEPDFVSTMWAFPRRNRIMAALADAVIVIEASKKSGTLITARLALDYNKSVGVVPGSIFSSMSEGTHWLLKQGATPITCGDDIRDILGFKKEENITQASLFIDISPDQREIVAVLQEPKSKSDIIEKLSWPAFKIQIVLMEMELKGLIVEQGGLVRLAR